MYLADYHVHTLCSPDGTATMADVAARAVEAGLQELCFTDHVDTVHWADYSPRDDFDWAEARRQFAEAQEKWGERIALRFGAELGEAHVGFGRAEKLLRDGGALDFVIGSVHTSSEKMGYFDLSALPKGEAAYYNDIMRGYIEENLRLVKWGKFHVLGHLLLPLWYIRRVGGGEIDPALYRDGVEEILRLLVDKGIGLELNAGVCADMYWAPTEAVLQRYRALGGEIITTGSDCHTLPQVGVGLPEAQEQLRRCGYRYFTTFEMGKPIFHKL